MSTPKIVTICRKSRLFVHLVRVDRKRNEKILVEVFPAETTDDYIRGWCDAKGHQLAEKL
jgi:hypothetical protein